MTPCKLAGTTTQRHSPGRISLGVRLSARTLADLDLHASVQVWLKDAAPAPARAGDRRSVREASTQTGRSATLELVVKI